MDLSDGNHVTGPRVGAAYQVSKAIGPTLASATRQPERGVVLLPGLDHLI